MCLALIAINQHPLYPIIILSNRDEFYERKSAPANFWNESPQLFAGKDLSKNGTWLGVNRNGCFSLITNYRNPKLQDASLESRGLIVKNYLVECETVSQLKYIKKLKPYANRYNPFNLIIGDRKGAYYYSNVSNQTKKLSAGLYAISNHLLDTPWYKAEKAKALFLEIMNETAVSADSQQIRDRLFSILADSSLAPDHLLPNTGIAPDLEKSLSAIFVHSPEHKYGTQSSTVILFEKKHIVFSEKIFVNGFFSSLETTTIAGIYP